MVNDRSMETAIVIVKFMNSRESFLKINILSLHNKFCLFDYLHFMFFLEYLIY